MKVKKLAEKAKIFISSRQKMIIDRLLESDFPIMPKDIAEELDISLRTCQREIAQLKPIVRTYGLKIMKQFRSGICLVGEQENKDVLTEELEKARQQTSFSPKDRQIGIVCDLLRDQTPTKMFVFSKKYYVTEATISHDLNELEEWLNHFHLTLVRKPGLGIYIVGEDKDLRAAITTVVNNSTLPENWLAVFDLLKLGKKEDWRIEKYIPSMYLDLLDLDILYAVEKVLTEAAEQNPSLFLNERDRISVSLHLALAAERHKDKKHGHLNLDSKLMKLYPSAFYIAARLRELLDIELPEEEINYLILHLYGVQPDLPIEQLQEEETTHLVRIFIEGVKKELNQPLTDPMLSEGLLKHFYPALNRIRNGLPIHNPLFSQIQRDYPDVYEASRKSAESLSDYLGVTIPPSEIAYMAIHVGAALVNQQNIKGRVVIVCASGFGTSRLIASRLKQEIPGIYVSGVISINELPKWLENNWQVDAIVSTIQISAITEERLIVVSPILTENDLQKIKSILKKQQSTDQILFASDHFSEDSALIEVAYYGEAFAQLMRSLDWMEAIPTKEKFTWLNAIVSQSHAVISSEELIEAFKERERKGSFVIGSIGILHSRTSAVRTLFANIISLKETIPWHSENGQKQSVNTVLLLAGPPDAPREHFPLLGELISGLLDNVLAEAISSGNKEQALFAVRDHLQQAYQEKILNYARGKLR
ncbi:MULTISPECIES: BglG family transcription antiterminator [unclassified Peribacillus]|uniref:BglG family transcription antiterminator n=1 Tax=unclassified Peribacillus TaxID=2675266 RepID=UPI0019120913|nr:MULTISPECIES: BglG family transcription antiterminator [unclassified Peribacillus]MBK5502650.1 BglG family transcription antiterminator [Peribacillus sp. TH14]WMX58803.1 BglG family transcription antiterminator [Peribacillus sp. R9-11]